MMKLKTLLISTLTLFPFFVQAKELKPVDLKEVKHPVKPLLWKIEGKGLKTPSYLFGTIHLSDLRVTTLHPLAQEAFGKAGAVYTEIDLSSRKQIAGRSFYMREKGDQTLENLIGKDVTDYLNLELQMINRSLHVKQFEQMKLWAITSILPQLKSQMHGRKPLDAHLWQRAERAGKKTGALETFKSRANKFDQFTLEEQKYLLVLTLKSIRLAREKEIDVNQVMIAGYLRADQEALMSELSKDSHMGIEINLEMRKKFLHLMLHERNKDMAEAIQKALQEPQSES